MNSSILLFTDAAINLGLGLLLLVFPQGLIDLLGIPDPESMFYPNILGAVLLGIGIALLIQRYKTKERIVGLGLAGAVVINLSGGVVLIGWLLFGDLTTSATGLVLLWALALILFGISAIELRIQFSNPASTEAA